MCGHKTKIICAFASVIISTIFASQAYGYTGDAYNNCINNSGGRGGIESVAWACQVKANEEDNTCALWIGTSHGQTTTITTDTLSGSYPIYFYGMCTKEAHDASNVSVGHHSISAPSGGIVHRGGWGSPLATATTLNLAEFVRGLTPVEYGDYEIYSRIVSVYRCYSGGGTCSSQNVAVNVQVPAPKYTLSAVPVDFYSGSGITGGYSWSTGPWKRGAWGTIDAKGFTGYDFMGWKSNRYNSWADKGGAYTYGQSMYGDTTIYPSYLRHKFSGIASVAESANTNNSASSGWVSDGNNSTGSIRMECNNYADGCTANFSLNLSRTQGNGSTPYIIYRTITGSNNQNITSGTFYSSGGPFNYSNQKLYPGQTMCYYITFKPFGVRSNEYYATAGACAYAKPSLFQAQSSSGSASTGFVSGSKTVIRSINNCSAKTGCKASFEHKLKRTEGIGSTNYTVSRLANYWSSVKTLQIGATSGTIKSDNFRPSNNGEHVVSTSGEWTLLPGVVICESLTFYPNNNYATGDYLKSYTTKVCASALGSAQPDDPSNPDTPNPDKPGGDETASAAFLNIKVRNNSVASNNSNYKFQTTVYGKPHDNLTYRATYNPLLQYTYNLVPQKMQIDGGAIRPANSINMTSKLYSMFNTYKTTGMRDWSNSFSVYTTENFQFDANYAYPNGNVDYRMESNDHKIRPNEVGYSLNEHATLNRNYDTRTTPWNVNFSKDSAGTNIGNVITNRNRVVTAHALVPYNFINTTNITTESKPIIAGEETTIEYDININTKENPVTDGTYSTIVRNAQWKLRVCFDGTCYETLPETGILNEQGKFDGQVDKKKTTIHVPDTKAGTEVCVWSAVYPANSGAHTNYQDPAGSHTWQYSANPVCYTVAKKPNLEVWGGNVYSNGKITTSTSVKKHLYGTNNYYVDVKNSSGNANYNTNYVFGSWGEYGVLSVGEISGFGSGAGLGFATNSDGVFWPNYHPANGAGNNANTNALSNYGPGGSVESAASSSPCIRNTLTFANFPCDKTHQTLGVIGDSITSTNVAENRDEIIARLAFNGVQNVSGNVTLNDESKKRDYNIYYYYGNNDNLSVQPATLQNNTTQVVHSNNTINITGNITYGNNFTTLAEVPKLVIYANNIVIDCNVTKLHALLIAKQNVKTCNSDDINARENSNQLMLKGAVVANSLTANRTYGAASGANSMIPAEIIDFDPTLYSWGGDRTGEHTGDGKIETTYLYELSPRY